MAREDVTPTERQREIYEMSFWDVEETAGIAEIKVRETTVHPVTAKDVREFSRRYHYTGVGGNAQWRWGLWSGPLLLGVVAYNLPTRQTCASVFGDQGIENVWHMGRLAMADAAPRNSESRLIAGSLAQIQRDYSNVWAVLTFAAVSAGHIGYVYQATNAIYTGTGGDTSYLLDCDGNRRGTKQGGRLTKAEIAARGWTSVKEPPKHRYVYILGNKAERRARRELLRLPVLPYPKGDAA